jgi:DNA invertase Pin-like site-specific DNA recombinase
MFVGILAVLAQFDAELTAEKTACALAQLQSNGKHVGRPPFGWRVGEDGRLERAEGTSEAAAATRISELRAAGASASSIALQLGAETGRRWHETQVRRILVRSKEAA